MTERIGAKPRRPLDDRATGRLEAAVSGGHMLRTPLAKSDRGSPLIPGACGLDGPFLFRTRCQNVHAEGWTLGDGGHARDSW
jgi:hypothetical protein